MATTLTLPKDDNDALKAELAKLREENEAMKAKLVGKAGRMKVTEKGGVSLYGMGRFPVTLYEDQWIRLLEAGADIRKFLVDNNARLKKRD
jgi:hypothetical protein